MKNFAGEMLMMKRACVFVFSGTGMTSYVVSLIKTEVEKLNLSLDICKIESVQAQAVFLQDYDIIGIAYPVHSFNAPKIVIDFARQLPQMKNINTFIISTAGDESQLNSASSNLLMRILDNKNYNVFYNKQHIMPSNFITKNTDKIVEQRLDTARKEAKKTAAAICELITCQETPKLFSKIMAFTGRLEWIGAKRMSKFFYVDSHCSKCGQCIKLCPNKNIIAKESIVAENIIAFNKNCGLCMRCIYICPCNAIKIRRPFRFFSIGSWYENKELNKIN